jgi:hypothetical protein
VVLEFLRERAVNSSTARIPETREEVVDAQGGD